MRADCFFRAWHRDRARMLSARNVRVVTVEVPAGSELRAILDAALAAGASKGTHYTGIYEVQTDEGIWSTVDGRRHDLATPRRAARSVFKTWDELEAAE